MLIKKRDGRKEEFKPSRIEAAVFKAFSATGEGTEKDAKKVTAEVVERADQENGVPTVEGIQDRVEETLMRMGYFRTAKAYIIYRQQHTDLRDVKRIVEDPQVIESYLNRSDWKVKENSNMTYSLQGLNCYLSSKVVSNYWLRKIYPPGIREHHLAADFHLHDLGTLGPYCVGWDIKDVLLRGFSGVPGKVTCTPAKHFKVALGQVVNFLYTLQGEAAGAQAFSNVDTYLAPFIRYDGLSYKQVQQAMQEFIYNLNVPTRVGFQTPFVNFTLDLKPPSFAEDEPAIVGGQAQNDPIGDFQDEMDMFNRAFGEVMTAGDGDGRPFTFPIPTINITKDFEWDNENYWPLWQMTSRYGIPYFSNFVNSDMSPDDVRSMCCRLRLDKRELQKRGGGLFGANPLTGSIGVVTLNLPRLGYLSGGEDEFYERLDELMDKAKDSLEIKRNVINNFTDNGLYPYSKVYLQGIKERYDSYWQNHFSTIGIIGMNECLRNLINTSLVTTEGRDFALDVMDHMRERISQYQEETGDIFNLEATPAEGASHRLARIDKAEFPDIVTANNGGGEFYTNSTHLPVDYTGNLFEALSLQDDLQCKYTGGTVFHVFLGESGPHPESLKRLVDKVTSSFSLPYFTITPTFSVCQEHGYMAGEHPECPKCHRSCEVYSRSVGYLRPISQWNEGKSSEFVQRRTFDRKAEKQVAKVVA